MLYLEQIKLRSVIYDMICVPWRSKPTFVCCLCITDSIPFTTEHRTYKVRTYDNIISYVQQYQEHTKKKDGLMKNTHMYVYYSNSSRRGVSISMYTQRVRRWEMELCYEVSKYYSYCCTAVSVLQQVYVISYDILYHMYDSLCIPSYNMYSWYERITGTAAHLQNWSWLYT